MSAATLLDRLDGVRRTGDRRWLARCPAHEDRSPSLSIRETDDGRTLVHCFGGCHVGDVVESVGLELSDLMPPRALDHRAAPLRTGLTLREALMLVEHELTLIVIGLANWPDVEPGDVPRIRQAVEKIQTVANGIIR